MTEEKKPEQEHKDHLVFVGLRDNGYDREPSAAFAWLTSQEGARQRVDREIKTSELAVFPISIVRELRYCNPGSVYVMTKTEKGISYKPKSAPVFVLSNEQVTRWHTSHRAIERDWEAQKRLKKEATARPDRALLDPFRLAYTRLHGPAQAQLIADVVAYISRGRPKSE